MKRIQLLLCAFVAMFMLSVNSAWAQYVKLTAEDGTISWIEIEGVINGTNIEICGGTDSWDNPCSAISKYKKGAIDLNEVWARSDGRGTHYQVTSIGDNAFYSCSGLTSVAIPSSVTSIGDYAFASCSGLVSVNIPSSVTSIGKCAFVDCSGLTSLIIPSSVTSIGEGAFAGCSGLTSLIIPSSVTSIGEGAFAGCSGLSSVVISSNVTSIGYGMFQNCSGLTSIVIPSSVTYIDIEAFSGCSGLTSVDIPSSVAIIAANAFSGCSGLTSIVIPSGVIAISGSAFSGCSGLTSVVIPSSVTRIGGYAFSGCSSMVSVTSYITDVFETGKNTFKDCDNATLYVPIGLVNTYRSTADWNRFNKIEEMPETIALSLSCNNKGMVLVNGTEEFTNDLVEVNIKDGVDNTFVFQPNNNCELRQVLIDGLDVTLSVENNQLTTKVHEGSKMIVMFDKTSSDVNGDGTVDISDVVRLVNIILGQ